MMPSSERTNPTMARFRPACCTGLFLICDNATDEKMIPRILNTNTGPQQNRPTVMERIPITSPATAMLFVAGALPVRAACAIGMGGADCGAAPSEPTNSGKVDNGFHGPPSNRANVCPLARPSAIQARTSSAATGPYSFWSAPMRMYMSRGSLDKLCQASLPPSDAGSAAQYEAGCASETGRRALPPGDDGLSALSQRLPA